jgi:hypothetical protein
MMMTCVVKSNQTRHHQKANRQLKPTFKGFSNGKITDELK